MFVGDFEDGDDEGGQGIQGGGGSGGGSGGGAAKASSSRSMQIAQSLLNDVFTNQINEARGEYFNQLAMLHGDLLGSDRYFNSYYMFRSIPGVFVERYDDVMIAVDTIDMIQESVRGKVRKQARKAGDTDEDIKDAAAVKDEGAAPMDVAADADTVVVDSSKAAVVKREDGEAGEGVDGAVDADVAGAGGSADAADAAVPASGTEAGEDRMEVEVDGGEGAEADGEESYDDDTIVQMRAARYFKLPASEYNPRNVIKAKWSRFEDIGEVDRLIAALNPVGARERLLKKRLQGSRDQIAASLVLLKQEQGQQTVKITSAAANMSASEHHAQTLAKDLLKFEAKLHAHEFIADESKGADDGVFSRPDWQGRVRALGSAEEAKELVLELCTLISPKDMSRDWPGSHLSWKLGLSNSATLSDVALHLTVFQHCVDWRKRGKHSRALRSQLDADDGLNMKHCNVCHDGGEVLCCDYCPLVFHLACLNPPLADVPEGKWMCPTCESSGQAKYVNMSENQSEFDRCRQCLTGGNLLWCDSCPNCYHLQCLDPPLKAAPTGDWFCSACCVSRPVVWAKVRGYPMWPAKVLSENKKRGLELCFFGTHDVTFVPPSRTFAFEEKEGTIPELVQTTKFEKLKTALEEVQKYVQNIRSLNNGKLAELTSTVIPTAPAASSAEEEGDLYNPE